MPKGFHGHNLAVDDELLMPFTKIYRMFGEMRLHFCGIFLGINMLIEILQKLLDRRQFRRRLHDIRVGRGTAGFDDNWHSVRFSLTSTTGDFGRRLAFAKGRDMSIVVVSLCRRSCRCRRHES